MIAPVDAPETNEKRCPKGLSSPKAVFKSCSSLASKRAGVMPRMPPPSTCKMTRTGRPALSTLRGSCGFACDSLGTCVE